MRFAFPGRMYRIARGLSLSFLLCLVTGCSQLSSLASGLPAAATRPDPPKVSVQGVTLVSAPGEEELARYYCPLVAPGLVCRAFGAAPPAAALRFVFDVALLVENPNTIPLPAVEALVALTAYPDSGQQAKVGAACIALCPEGEDCGPAPAGACMDGGPGLQTMEDYAMAAAGFLTRVALDDVRVSDVRVRTIPAGASTVIQARFELDPEAMLQLIGTVAGDALASVQRGRVPELTVPYLVEGSLWVNIEQFGKIGAAFGPYRDAWAL